MICVIDFAAIGGMETAAIAEVFGLTERSVQREWNRVHALLTLALEAQDA